MDFADGHMLICDQIRIFIHVRNCFNFHKNSSSRRPPALRSDSVIEIVRSSSISVKHRFVCREMTFCGIYFLVSLSFDMTPIANGSMVFVKFFNNKRNDITDSILHGNVSASKNGIFLFSENRSKPKITFESNETNRITDIQHNKRDEMMWERHLLHRSERHQK